MLHDCFDLKCIECSWFGWCLHECFDWKHWLFCECYMRVLIKNWMLVVLNNVYVNVTWLFWLKVLNACSLNNVYVNVTWLLWLKILNAPDLNNV
jgi:hypothetical protein